MRIVNKKTFNLHRSTLPGSATSDCEAQMPGINKVFGGINWISFGIIFSLLQEKLGGYLRP